MTTRQVPISCPRRHTQQWLVRNILGCIVETLWDVYLKHYGICIRNIMGCVFETLWDVYSKHGMSIRQNVLSKLSACRRRRTNIPVELERETFVKFPFHQKNG